MAQNFSFNLRHDFSGHIRFTVYIQKDECALAGCRALDILDLTPRLT